jgi:hypothetical protein
LKKSYIKKKENKTMKYNYIEALKNDIRQYMEDNESYLNYTDREDLEEQLNDLLWTADSVTGNASGSYTFNSAEAKEYVMDNMPLAVDAFREFDQIDKFADYIQEENYEAIDVTIRCFLLGQVLYEVLEEDYKEPEEE